MLRSILSRAVLPSLEKEISASVGKEISAMEENFCLAPRVFSYMREGGGTSSTAAGSGAFGVTARAEAPSSSSSATADATSARFVRVEREATTRGLFE